MKQDNQLSLCDPHNSIIHEFGCESSCIKAAAICRKGCSEYEHKQKASKHEFMHARQFYTILSHLRQDYKVFSATFESAYVDRYINEIKQALKTFKENILGKINEQNSLVNIYSRNAGQIFQILREKQEDVEFAEIKCKDVFQLKHFYNSLTKKNGQEQQEKRVMKSLMKMFEDHLRHLKLISQPIKPQKQQKNKFIHTIEGDNLEQVTIKTKQCSKKKQNKQPKDHFDELFIKIRENMDQLRNGCEIKTKLDAFFQAQHSLIQLIRTPELALNLAVKGIISASPFWLQFMNFVERERIKKLNIMTSEQTSQSQSLKKQLQRINRDKFTIQFVTGDWENNLQSLIMMLNK